MGIYEKPKTKKAFKEMVTQGKGTFQATSMMGNEYDGPIDQAPIGNYTVVGPCAYTKRNWYASVKITDKGIKIS